ncbi:MAG: hypothetical protein U0401_07635 [Anaerolineae bacterium]
MAANVYVNSGRHLTSFGGKSLAEDFGLLMEVMADILLQPNFPSEEVEKVRGQIITSLKESLDSTRSMAGHYFREMLYTPIILIGKPMNGSLETIPPF